jgi:hypothetical protein
MSKGLPTGKNPELPDWDEEDEDEIMSELRQIRRDIMAKFNNDFDAYWRYLQTRRAFDRLRGFREADLPRVTPNFASPIKPETEESCDTAEHT